MWAPPPARACRHGSQTGRSPSTGRRSGGRRHARRSATSWPSRCPMPCRAAVMAAEDVRLDLLYEDEHFLALDKPAGIVVHPSYRNTEGTVMNALLWHARGWPDSQRPSLVGRLDKLTSGVVIVAKTAAIHAALQRAMASSRSEKDYLAVVYGRVNVARGEIDLRLGRDRGDRRRVVGSATVGAPSLTRFERLARVAAPRAGLSLLRCRLETGRTHQIRVHLAARGWPLVGDPTYGEPRWSADRRSRARRDAPRVSAPGASRVAHRADPSDHRRAGGNRGARAGRSRRVAAGVGAVTVRLKPDTEVRCRSCSESGPADGLPPDRSGACGVDGECLPPTWIPARRMPRCW